MKIQNPTMSLTDAIYKRRAVRAYTPQKIDKNTINSLLESAVHAPTAMHQESWKFAIIQDKKILDRISDSAKKFLGEDHNLHSPKSSFDRFKQPDFNIFYDASTLIVICGKLKGPFVEADCWLAAENLMLTACSMGLGTCVIGLAVATLNTPEWKKELGIPLDMTAFAPIILGVPSGETAATPRKKPEILVWK